MKKLVILLSALVIVFFSGCGGDEETTNISCCCDTENCVQTCTDECAVDGSLTLYKTRVLATTDKIDYLGTSFSYMTIEVEIPSNQAANVVLLKVELQKPEAETNFKDIYISSYGERYSSDHNFNYDKENMTISLDPNMLFVSKAYEKNTYQFDIMVSLKDGVMCDVNNTISIVNLVTRCSEENNDSSELPYIGTDLEITNLP